MIILTMILFTVQDSQCSGVLSVGRCQKRALGILYIAGATRTKHISTLSVAVIVECIFIMLHAYSDMLAKKKSCRIKVAVISPSRFLGG